MGLKYNMKIKVRSEEKQIAWGDSVTELLQEGHRKI